MIDARLKEFLDKVLNDNGVILGNDTDVIYYCPFCHHRKRKLQINLDSDSPAFESYNCWVCKNQNNSSGSSLATLLRKISASTIYREELKSVVKSRKTTLPSKFNTDIQQGKISDIGLTLPKEFIPLYEEKNTPEYRNALYYVLNKRKLTKSDILRYNIGYCEEGYYAGMIIIPSYDEYGILNYFVGRSYYDTNFGKHKNPKWSRNIVGFEVFINWKQPLIIAEGAFDAISAKRNAIPLFGKDISENLLKKIIKNRVKKIYLALDQDAIKDLVHITEKFQKMGIEITIIKMDKKDPNECGYNKFIEIINSSEKTTFKDLMKIKLGFKK